MSLCNKKAPKGGFNPPEADKYQAIVKPAVAVFDSEQFPALGNRFCDRGDLLFLGYRDGDINLAHRPQHRERFVEVLGPANS